MSDSSTSPEVAPSTLETGAPVYDTGRKASPVEQFVVTMTVEAPYGAMDEPLLRRHLVDQVCTGVISGLSIDSVTLAVTPPARETT